MAAGPEREGCWNVGLTSKTSSSAKPAPGTRTTSQPDLNFKKAKAEKTAAQGGLLGK